MQLAFDLRAAHLRDVVKGRGGFIQRLRSENLGGEEAEERRRDGGSDAWHKTARELRQRGSDYRCCIPALAGFVSPQSIAPDGAKIFREARARAKDFFRAATDVDSRVRV